MFKVTDFSEEELFLYLYMLLRGQAALGLQPLRSKFALQSWRE